MKTFLSKQDVLAIFNRISNRYWERALRTVQGGFSLPKPRTEEEKRCASGKCQHFSCAVAREMIKLSQIDTRDFLIGGT